MMLSRKLLSIPGGRLMLILVPWKPVVVAWSLLAAMLWVGYVGYSVLEGKNPFAMAQHKSYHPHTRSTADTETRNKSNPDSR
jgi:hypothetical protein